MGKLPFALCLLLFALLLKYTTPLYPYSPSRQLGGLFYFYTMTIENVQHTVDQWIKTIGIRYYNELTNTAILMEEVGEVARLMARLYGEQSFKTPELAATAKEDLADEMADVLFVLVCLANQTGVNLTEALQKNLDKKTRRDAARHAGNEKLK